MDQEELDVISLPSLGGYLPESLERVRKLLEHLEEHPRREIRDMVRADTWGFDRVWMVGRIRRTSELGRPVKTWTHKYLTALSLVPRRVSLQVIT